MAKSAIVRMITIKDIKSIADFFLHTKITTKQAKGIMVEVKSCYAEDIQFINEPKLLEDVTENYLLMEQSSPMTKFNGRRAAYHILDGKTVRTRNKHGFVEYKVKNKKTLLLRSYPLKTTGEGIEFIKTIHSIASIRTSDSTYTIVK